MKDSTTLELTEGQQLALDQLRRIVQASRGSVAATHVAATADGYVEARVSIGCANLPPTQDGLRLRSVEAVTLRIPANFPFTAPSVQTRHTRFAGAPHVNWSRHLCLYRSTATEWDPADGMYGFITRLLDWLEAAAAGQLDRPGEPLHPPNALTDHTAGLLVIRHDAPVARPDGPWLGAAVLHQVNDIRSDVVGWLAAEDPWPDSLEHLRESAGLPADARAFLAPVVVTTKHLTFEYPLTARELVESLARDHITPRLLLGLTGFVAGHNRTLLCPDADATASTGDYEDAPAAPVHLLLGTPSRGIAGGGPRRTHLVSWHLPDFADQVGRLAADTAFSGHAYLAELGDKVVRFGTDWLDRQNTRWMPVYEARPEVTVRRDHSSPAAWLRGKRILVLGAGALGAPVADMCARAGAAHLTVADHGLVHPGILARQPYTDADIGFFKARVLADRLNRIDPHATRVEALVGNVTTRLSALDLHTFDLIWDCTANRIVRAHLERTRRTDTAPWPHLATLMIGHHATRGIAAISPRGATGGGTDVLRRTALAAHADATRAFDDLIDDFFPTTPPTELFQPEPGCSDATFTGSAADVTALAGQLATGVLHALAEPADRHTMAALIVRMPTGPTSPQPPGPRWLTWSNDTLATDEATGYDVRITPVALAEMRAEARRGARVRGPRVETGGTLLGAVDDATGVIFIDEATGPPPDSLLTEAYFQHGLDGVSGHLTARRKATGNISRFLGMWHTHPHAAAQPSATDRAAMASLTLPLDDAPARALVLIAGGPPPVWHQWLATGDRPDLYAHLATRTAAVTAEPPPPQPPAHLSPVPWWPGGYSTRPHSPVPVPRKGPRS
ncbi:ThiF family adenylyltransferase [Streptomyces rubiginosohelvolus]|uniref:ThiF family adenylyltransferase n=1 Tax=Streptomyces rubiginosohelvolus TaxID=67362 RepID=UPI0036FB77C1